MAKKSNDDVLGILVHILALFLGFIGPLIILLAAKEGKTKMHAKSALNWQLSLIIYLIIGGMLVFVLIGILVLAILGILNVIFCVVAAVRAADGEVWKYPLSIQFFKVK